MRLVATGVVCLGIVASALLLMEAEGRTEVVPDFTGTSSAVFVNPQPASATVAGVGTNSFSWGAGGGSSNLSFVGGGFSGAFGEVLPLGVVTYSNGASTTGVAGSVEIRLTIKLTTPAAVNQPFTQTFALLNTPNIDGNPGASADFVLLPSDFPNVVFVLEGVTYTLNFIGFGIVTGAGKTEGLSRFRVLEGGTASAQLLGSITQACVTEAVDPVREDIFNFRNCGKNSIGSVAANWGRFGSKDVLEADSGDQLYLSCEGVSVVGAAYKLYYARKGGEPLRVGICPFQAGCNTAQFYHSGDKNNNGKPDCFIKTMWNSADYDEDDKNPNPWTGKKEETENLLDWAVTLFNVNSNFLEKKSYKWEYAVGPPVLAECKDTTVIPTGALVKSSSIDPPLGPETEAFFDAVEARMTLLPPSDVPMGASSAKACDLDGNGKCDGFDAFLFENLVDTCSGHFAYSPRADVDQSGCVDARDRRYLFLNDEDGDGLSDAADNCPTTVNPGQADANGNGLGDACEATSVVGDLDNDGDVDRIDVAILLAARNTNATGPTDPRDLNRDGKITALDGRKLALLCTRPGCAIR